MLCWVVSDEKYYRYDDGTWTEFTTEIDMSKIENILYRVTTYQDMAILDTSQLKFGYLCHVIEDENNNYMYYYSSNGWTAFKQIGTTVWIGEDEPPDKSLLWIDTSDTIENIDTTLLESITNEFTSIVKDLNSKIADLENRIKQLENKD